MHNLSVDLEESHRITNFVMFDLDSQFGSY